MRMALDAVSEGQADACISAGNTGALMAPVSLYLEAAARCRPACVGYRDPDENRE